MAKLKEEEEMALANVEMAETNHWKDKYLQAMKTVEELRQENAELRRRLSAPTSSSAAIAAPQPNQDLKAMMGSMAAMMAKMAENTN